MTGFETVISSTQDLVITVMGLAVASVLGWWKGKTGKQKKQLFTDILTAKANDGKITIDEAIELINEHL